MAKSYKICLCSSFDKTHFNNGKLRLNPQASLFPKNSSTPETNIERSQLGKIYQDFESFRIYMSTMSTSPVVISILSFCSFFDEAK